MHTVLLDIFSADIPDKVAKPIVTMPQLDKVGTNLQLNPQTTDSLVTRKAHAACTGQRVLENNLTTQCNLVGSDFLSPMLGFILLLLDWLIS